MASVFVPCLLMDSDAHHYCKCTLFRENRQESWPESCGCACYSAILISYAKLLKVIIVPFSWAKLERITQTNSCIKFSNNSEIVWLFNGNTPFSDPRHVSLVVFAGLVLLFLFLPYTFLLLCGHWLHAKSHW